MLFCIQNTKTACVLTQQGIRVLLVQRDSLDIAFCTTFQYTLLHSVIFCLDKIIISPDFDLVGRDTSRILHRCKATGLFSKKTFFLSLKSKDYLLPIHMEVLILDRHGPVDQFRIRSFLKLAIHHSAASCQLNDRMDDVWPALRFLGHITFHHNFQLQYSKIINGM